ncbi:hypothetical protein RFI_18004, partial [Reticulomyxa filosa]
KKKKKKKNKTIEKWSNSCHHELALDQRSLTSLEQVLEWTPGDELNRCSVALKYSKWHNTSVSNVGQSCSSSAPPTRPLVCVCHDMAGGYHFDKWNQGYHYGFEQVQLNGVGQMPLEYTLHFWQYVDVFVYFSHDFITIPPKQWIDVAHRNQTMILGTLITEHAKGSQLSYEISCDDEKREKTVEKLVSMAEYYGFDGYFLNFESHLTPVEYYEDESNKEKAKEKSDKCCLAAKKLVEFVDLLTKALKRKLPHAKVLWYDSISIFDGTVSWQSCLNDHGLSFFNICEFRLFFFFLRICIYCKCRIVIASINVVHAYSGFFTDYHWGKEFPQTSLDYCRNRKFFFFFFF